jgi:uncharacterized peroxidase-related enzyme
VADWRTADLTDRQRSMLAYADKLTRTPWDVRREDVEALKVAGLTETEVLDLNQIVGYYAYVNRLADGLGVPLEEFWDQAD